MLEIVYVCVKETRRDFDFDVTDNKTRSEMLLNVKYFPYQELGSNEKKYILQCYAVYNVCRVYSKYFELQSHARKCKY